MTDGEIRKRLLANRVFRLIGEDPYAEDSREPLKAKLWKAIHLINRLDFSERNNQKNEECEL